MLSVSSISDKKRFAHLKLGFGIADTVSGGSGHHGRMVLLCRCEHDGTVGGSHNAAGDLRA